MNSLRIELKDDNHPTKIYNPEPGTTVFLIEYSYEFTTDVDFSIWKGDTRIYITDDEFITPPNGKDYWELNDKIMLDSKYFVYLKGLHITNTLKCADDRDGHICDTSDDDPVCFLKGTLHIIELVIESEEKKKRIDEFPDLIVSVDSQELADSLIGILDRGDHVFQLYKDLGKTHLVQIWKEKNNDVYEMSARIRNLQIGAEEEEMLEKICQLLTETQTPLDGETWPGGDHELFLGIDGAEHHIVGSWYNWSSRNMDGGIVYPGIFRAMEYLQNLVGY